MKIFWDALKRTLALVGSEIATIMGAGSVMNVEPWKLAIVAAISAAFTVWGKIGRAYYTDGQFTSDELNEIFGGFGNNLEKEQPKK
jgi:hypothetical protein